MSARPDVGIFFGRPDRCHALAGELRRRGFPVTVYNDPGAPGTDVPVRCAFGPALVRLAASRHDVYLTSLSFVPSLSLALNRCLRGRPYVFNATGLKRAMYRDRARRWAAPWVAERLVYPALTRLVLAGAARIVCNSHYLERRLRAAYPRHAAKMCTVYNGIDVARFAPAAAPRPAGATAPTLVAVMTWNYPGKAAAARLLIDAMGPITGRYPGARLVIAAKMAHGRYRPAIEAALAAKPWRDAVEIVVNHPRVEELLATADLFLYATAPDSNDSLPRALLEAQAAGLAVVTTATAGCPEIVEDGVTGYVVPCDAAALADRALDLLGDPDRRVAFGRQGRARVATLFSWARMGEAYARLFLEIAAGRTRQARAVPSQPLSGARS